MPGSLEQRISKIDWRKAGEENEERAVVRVIVNLIIDEFIQSRFRRKKNNRGQVQNGRRDEDKHEKQKRPRLLIAPAIENPPSDDQIDKQVHDPDGVNPINATVCACLQHFSHAGKNRVIPRARIMEMRTER